jgi:hypothetical protein
MGNGAQEAVASASRRCLQAVCVRLQRRCIQVDEMKRRSHLPGQIANEGGVLSGRRTQSMIDVGDMKLKSPEGSKLCQRMQEDNAVYAAAHANDHRLEVISQRLEKISWR